MAKLGSFGGITFIVSENIIRTFDGMKWDVSAKYATHDRHLQSDLLEFLGPEPDGITFTVKLSAFLGTNPMQEVKKLRQMTRTGQAERLVLGSQVYGSYKWVITKLSVSMQTFDSRGNCLAADVSLTLKEYGRQ